MNKSPVRIHESEYDKMMLQNSVLDRNSATFASSMCKTESFSQFVMYKTEIKNNPVLLE